MSLFKDYLKHQVDGFGGSWPLLETTDVPPGKALRSENVEFLPGIVKTRLGFASKFPNLLDSITSMASWLTIGAAGVPQVFLAYHAPNDGSAHAGVNILDVDTGTRTLLYNPFGNPSVKGASFSGSGPRLFVATFDKDGYGVDQGRVYGNPNVFSGGGLDTLFAPAINGTSVVITDSGSGNLTGGSYRLGYLITTRNGFTTSPSPIAGSPATFTYVPFSSAANRKVNVAVTAAWPSYAASIQLIMTPSLLPNTWFIVPGTITTVPGGSSSTVNIGVNINDADLAAQGVSAEPYFNLLTTFTYLTGIPSPSVIGEYNSRMVYIMRDPSGIDEVAISDPDNYQRIAVDQNILFLPGQKRAISFFVLYRTLYILGPHWTYQLQDTGDVPMLWPTMSLTDGRIGTHAPRGVAVNASRGFAWIADTDGLYLFSGGSYSPRPVSYFQSTIWSRINWAAAAVVQVVDHAYAKRVHVLVPLDGATAPTHILTFDYSQGVTPETVNFSLDSLQNFPLGSIANGIDNARNLLRLWLGPIQNTAGREKPILEKVSAEDSPLYTDNGQTILSAYQTALMPGVDNTLFQHHADSLRLQGSGLTKITGVTLDGGKSVGLNTVLEASAPAALITRKYHLLSEGVTLLLETQAPGDWFQLSELIHWYSPWVMHR